MMWVLKCSNRQDCEFAQKELFVKSSSYVLKYDKRRRRMFPFSEENVKCPVCGRDLRWEEVTSSVANFGVSTFNGLSDEDKKAVLKQRFDADNKRTGNDIKNKNHRKAVEKMIGYGK